MSVSTEGKHSKITGGLWIAANATTPTMYPDQNREAVPAGFTREYQILTEMCSSMSSGFMLLNPHGHVTYSNESALRLLRLDTSDRSTLQEFDVQQHMLTLLADPQQSRGELDQIWQHLEQESSTDLALIDAAANWLRMRSFPVHDEQGQLLGRGVLLDDITLERSLTDARTETLVMAAHEFKTPLAIIKGCATTLLGGSARWDPSMQREMLQMIDTQSDRLYDVLNTLLDVWRFDAGAQPLHLTQVNFPELLMQLIKRWQQQAPDQRFVLDIPNGVPAVHCDALRIEMALNHLLNNAIMYSSKGQIVRLALDYTDEELRVSVSDEGIGIASEHLDRIFDRFYRVEHTSNLRPSASWQGEGVAEVSHAGSGLGLSAARATIEGHRGKIWADSLGVGQGSTFFFTLPLAAHSFATQTATRLLDEPDTVVTQQRKTRSNTSPLDQGRRVRVLMAENDARLARYIQANLEEQYAILASTGFRGA
jgi:signal transduction histidine kinase